MTNVDKWCLGWPPQPAHVPSDGVLITTNEGRGARFCEACWRRWNAEDFQGNR
jgi:hypothetical protein